MQITAMRRFFRNDGAEVQLRLGGPTKAVAVKTLSEILSDIKANLYDAGVPTPTATSATIFHRSTSVPKEEQK